MASNEWLVRKLHEQDKKIEALSRGGTGVGHTSIAPGENLTVISDNGEVVLGAGGVDHVDGPTPATPSAPTLKLGFGTIETTWDGSFAEGEDEDGVPLTAPVDFDVVEVHCSTDPEEEEWGEDTMRGQIKTREGGTITVGGFDVDDEVFVCLIALAKTGKRSAPSATASLVIEGLDFSALFNELDAANATIKNAGEVLVTEQGTLDEKLTEVDGTLNDLGQDLAAVEDAQAQLNTDLEDVMTSVDGKNTITWNPSAPSKASSPGKAVGDLWYRTSGNNIIGFWKWDGTDWVTQLLDVTTIPLIDIGAGTFGSLNGARLVAGSVAASSIAVGDFTNLATIDPVRGLNVTRPSSWATETVGDYTRTKPTSQDVLMFKDRTNSVPFRAGGQLRVEFVAKTDAYVRAQFRLWAYPQDEDGSTSGSRQITGGYIDFTAGGEQKISTTVDIPADFGDGVVYRSWIIGLAPHSTSSPMVNLGVRDVSIYRMTGQTLIQDGAVSTPKLAADVLEVKNLKATEGQLDEAVINKLFSDVVVAKTAVAEEFIGENAILTGAVTAPKITASEELWAKIAQFVKIRAEHIEADAIDGMVITGATIRSAATGARTLMSASGFEAYDNANERTFFADASTGEVSITGKLFTGKSGFSRVALDPTLWSSLPVYDETGTISGYASGAGVRVGVDASNSADFYHAALSNGSSSGVFRSSTGRSVVSVEETPLSGGRYASHVQLLGETSESKTLALFGEGIYSTYQDKANSAYWSRFTVRKNDASMNVYSGSFKSSASAGSGFARLSAGKDNDESYGSVDASPSSIDLFTSYSPRGGTAIVQLVNGTSTTNGHVNVSAEHINPLRVNYLGTGDSWIIPFRKSGTDWGYVGSSGMMGVNEFGIQSAASKNLVLTTTTGSAGIIAKTNGDVTFSDSKGVNFSNIPVSSGTGVNVTAGGWFQKNTSSLRYKTDVKPVDMSGFDVLSLEPKSFVYKDQKERFEKPRDEWGEYEEEIFANGLPTSYGLIAEEVEAAGGEFVVNYDQEGLPDSLNYGLIGVALIPTVRDLRDRITELERQLNE